MKIIRLIVFLVFLPLNSLCQNYIEWIAHFGSLTPYYGVESGRDIVTDTLGNIYVAGEFAQTVLIDGNKLISNGDKDIFLAKLNPLGRVLWIKNFGGVKGDWCGGICLDEHSNIYLSGTFRGTITLGNSAYNSISWYDIFLTKINNNGQIIWSEAFIGNGGNSTSAIASDNNGNLYLTGYYSDKLNFDSIQLQGPTGRTDLFVVKLNSDGKVIWAKSVKSNANNSGNNIVSDNYGHLYLTGSMWDSVYFDDHLLISTNSLGLLQAYIAKMEASTGKFLWAVGGGGEGWSEGTSVAVDNNGDAVLCGWYRNDLYFDHDSLSNGGNDEGPDDIFIAKFDNSGNLIWLKTSICNLYSNSYDITINRENEIFLTGYYRGQIIFEGRTFWSSVPSYYDIYILKLDNNGSFRWFRSFGGDSPMNDIGFGITSLDDNIYLTGFYSSNSRFEYKLLNCNGASDIFVLKLSDTVRIIPVETEDFIIYPNPCSNSFYIGMNNTNITYQYKLYDITGMEIPVKSLIQLHLAEIDISSLSGGIYFLVIQDLNNNSNIVRKIIKK